MIRSYILLLYAYTVYGIGYDAGGGDRTTCGRPYRAGRLYQPPCDLARLGYCVQAGQLYPWRAVKRFVKDNQGLMRRMYGDQRHGHVLRAELDDGDNFEEEWEKREKKRGGYGRWKPTPVRYAKYQHHDGEDNELDEDFDYDLGHLDEDVEPRYLRGDLANDDVLNTKFVISEQEAAIAIKLAELKAAAHFRPVHHRSQFTTQKTYPRSTKPLKSTTTSKPSNENLTTSKPSTTVPTTRYVATTFKMDTNKTEKIKESTMRLRSTKATTENSLQETTEEPTTVPTSIANSTTLGATEDYSEHSTTDTTTDRTTEASNRFSITDKTYINKNNTPENTSTSEKNIVSERLGENVKNNPIDSEEILTNDNKGGNQEQNIGSDTSLKQVNENFDQTGESSENSEVYSEDLGDLKQDEAGNNQAMLFQDVEQDPFKKKGTVNYDKMKGINACPVKEEVVAPFWANNTRGEVLALLNMYPFEQYVHWEKCTFEHRQMYCREGCRCEQQYRLHRLLAYDPNNECRGIFSDWFRFPSCCVCKCYDMPPEFRVTSRSPRFHLSYPEEINNNQEYVENND